jgi:hypothetical protein
MTEALLSETDVNRLVLDVREEVTARRMEEASVGPGQGYRTDIRPLDNVKKSDGGNSADYLAARVKRDRPDIAVRVEAGEFRSMRAAALEAGIVKPACPLKAAKKAVEKMDEDQFDAFMMWLETR